VGSIAYRDQTLALGGCRHLLSSVPECVGFDMDGGRGLWRYRLRPLGKYCLGFIIAVVRLWRQQLARWGRRYRRVADECVLLCRVDRPECRSRPLLWWVQFCEAGLCSVSILLARAHTYVEAV